MAAIARPMIAVAAMSTPVVTFATAVNPVAVPAVVTAFAEVTPAALSILNKKR